MKKQTASFKMSFWNKRSIAVGSMFFSLSLLTLSACGGGDDNDKSSAAEPSIETSYATKEDLPSCTSKRMSEVESTEDGKMYVCYDDSWKKIDYTEEEVENLPSCTEKRDGLVAFLSSSVNFVVCKNEKWQKQTPVSLENPKESSSSVVSSSSGDVDGGSENVSSSSSVKTSYVEVKTKSDLIECNSSNKDVRALLLSDSTYYTCDGTEWKKDEGYIGYDVVADRENLPQCNAGNAKQRAFAKKDSVFFFCDSVKWEPENAEGYLVKNTSILGAAHKGPFKFGSPLLLREMLLRNDSLIYSGREYVDEISSNAGDFVIPKVSTIYPYAVLEVRGLWRNEVTGEWSKDTMVLRALTELTSKVNVNLLTHLEYDRAINLIKKGYSVSAAKTQADYEIMTAFEITPTMSNSEAKETFGSGADPTLLAMASLFIGNRSEAEISSAINSFKTDIADDGVWNDAKTKAEMADWAEGFDYSVVRANVKSWNITIIPEFEAQLRTFWYNAYGLGGCGQNRNEVDRYGVVAPVTNTQSVNYNVHYICKSSGWQKATDFEKDTYKWSDGKSGEVKKGNVTETYYVFENGTWGVAKNETALGICDSKRSGEIGKINDTYYVCSSGKWSVATELQYDTYQFGAGKEGEVRKGKVNTSKYYVYENGSWRAAKNEAEKHLGVCIASREGEVGEASGSYYICKSKIWETPSPLEYDTYGWPVGTEGEVKAGNVNASNHYVYENGAWRECKNDIEYDLGACVISREGEVGKSAERYYTCKSSVWTKSTALEYDTYGWKAGTEGEVKAGNVNTSIYYIYKNGKWQTATSVEADLNGCTYSREGEVGKSGNAYYICKSKTWTTATSVEADLNGCTYSREGEMAKSGDAYYVCKSKTWKKATALEYDTYGKTCLLDGTIVDGEIESSNRYVCDGGSFRTATDIEISLDKGCVSYTDGFEIRKNLSVARDSVYLCNKSLWNISIEFTYGFLTDSRDGKIYKTIVIGTQTWMAENLNYADSSAYPSMKGRSSCLGNSADSCLKYGRLYSWAVAMDSAGTFSANGKDCGYGNFCTPTHPVRGVCPEGWHVPAGEEWSELYSSVESSPYALQIKGLEKWPDATDAYGFSALPIGKDRDEYYARFWSTNQVTTFSNGKTTALYLYLATDRMTFSGAEKSGKIFVRCLKD